MVRVIGALVFRIAKEVHFLAMPQRFFAVALLIGCTLTCAAEEFVSLMPKRDILEHWTVEGKAPAEAWTLRDGMIACSGQPYGFLRSRKVYRNYVLRAEWRFQAQATYQYLVLGDRQRAAYAAEAASLLPASEAIPQPGAQVSRRAAGP